MTEYKKVDDYTLLAMSELPAGGTLSRYFNFAAGEVTSIFSQKTEMKEQGEPGYEGAESVSISVSTALTSQMLSKNFSDFDDTHEIERMHALLKEQGGNPPPLNETLIGKINKNPTL